MKYGTSFSEYYNYYEKELKNGFQVFDITGEDFQESMLLPGDLLQLHSQYTVYHSMIYIGHGKYINCHGKSDIFFQKFDAVLEEYIYTPKIIKIIRKKELSSGR